MGLKVLFGNKDSYDCFLLLMLLKKRLGAGDSMVGGMVWAFLKIKPERSYPLGSCLWISSNE
jgi:fructose-1-phosphate kinase PfkB-like protein